MLNRLVIRNYALIDNLDISFSKDLNILTGETGAGKSIILGALSLLLGQRAESKYFYNQQKKCVIEGIFKVGEFHLADFFNDNDLDYDVETVLRREISSDGKSRSFINDTPVNLTTLKQLGEKLIDIHSQHATIEINDEAFQLNVLDIVARNQPFLEKYGQTYKTHQKTLAKLKDAIAESEQSKADQSYFQFQFDELEIATLQGDEQKILEQEIELLTHSEEIKRNLAQVIYLLNDNEQSVIPQLKEAVSNLQHTEKFNPVIAQLSERLRSSMIEINDISDETGRIEQHTSINESRTAEISERLNTIYTLQKKHRVGSVNELIDLQKNLSEKLNSILFADKDIEKLKAESAKLKAELLELAAQLSKNRQQVIPELENQVVEILRDLGMPQAQLKINRNNLAEDQLKITGCDQVQYLFSANKGQIPLPMNKVASGGELSRLMLSIKSLIARHTALPTIIFDEIDTGISGEIALKVGNIMENLAENLQVIAITHLPQIASRGKAHYRVYKDEQPDRTLSNIKILDVEERTLEIAQMLSGENPGEFALQNARELLNI